MKLIESILEANRQAPVGRAPVELAVQPDADALPVVGLTCVDPRLNALLPMRLGLPANQFIWLRSAGNIVTHANGNMVRSLALACAVKQAKEVMVIGHTDCAVCKATVLQLTESFKSLGVRREDLPDNLVEFFGLFASERQNVMRAVELIRTSPLIGSRVPVHGLLLDVENGRLEKIVDGYATLAQAHTVTSLPTFERPKPAPESSARGKSAPQENKTSPATRDDTSTSAPQRPSISDPRGKETSESWTVPQMKLGPLQLPEIEVSKVELPNIQIGDTKFDTQEWLQLLRQHDATPTGQTAAANHAKDAAAPTDPAAAEVSPESLFDKAKRYKVIGSDHKVYGPINGLKILQWIAEGRIGWDTPSQMEGSQEWRPLEMWAELAKKLLRQKLFPPKLPREREDRR